ncbi:MAG: hypothetical protein ACP5I8_01075 [Phycisphaerae bacterium]
MAQTSAQFHSGPSHLLLHPIMPLWLLVIIGLAALGLLVYLYAQQRDLAPRRTLIWLMVLRVTLWLLLMVVLAGPAVQWTRTHTAPGQLWLVLDHSKSMGVHDAQAGRRYALRWACALGLLPGYRDVLDRDLARLAALTQQLRGLHDQANQFTAASTVQAHRQYRQSLAALRAWRKRLAKLIGRLRQHTTAAPVVDQLQRAAQLLRHAIKRAATGTPAIDPASAAYLAVDVQLRDALRALQEIARTADDAYLTAQQSDVAVTAALKHVDQQTRAQLAVAILTRQGRTGEPSFRRLMRHDDVHIVSFAGTAYTTAFPAYTDPTPVLQSALNPTGDSTNISRGLLTAASRIERGRRADILLVSDGRQNVGSNPAEIARLLALHHVRTFALCIGSDQAPPGASIDAVNAPQWIYKHQYLKAAAIIHLRSLANKPVTVELLRQGHVEARRVLMAHRADAYKSARFKNLPPGPGVYAYSIKILPTAALRHAVQRTFRVTVRRDKLQVLFIDSQPGWNYQYLVNYFSRSHRVHLQAVLLHPAGIAGIAPPPPVIASPKNPGYLAQLLPKSRKAWESFDVIILGDIPANTLSPTAQQGLAYAIQTKGAALVIMAGREFMPQDWATAPLGRLFPIQFNSVWPPALLRQQNDRGFLPALTAQGVQSGLSQLGVDQRTDSLIWRSMPRWYWHSAYTQARADARVLWVIAGHTARNVNTAGAISAFQATRGRALLTTMSLGSGRVMYLASNQLWRLRYVHGYNVEDVFLGQLLRWASGSQLPAGGRFVRFGTNHSSYDQGRRVMVQARVLDDRLLPESALHFQALAMPITATPGASGKSLSPLPAAFTASMLPQSGVPGYYTGLLTGLPPGSYRVTLQGSGVHARMRNDPTATVRSLTIRVKSAGDLEMLDTTSDPAAIQQIADTGGGIALSGPFAGILASYMPPVKQMIKIPENTGFFAHPHSASTFWLHVLFMVLFIALLTAEWLIRRAAGMV